MDANTPGNGGRKLKNPGTTLLLVFLFGGPGLFSVSIPAGCAVLAVDVLIYALGVSTSGFGLILLIPWRIIALLSAMAAVTKYNRDALERQER